MDIYNNYFAADYSCGSYGGGAYNVGDCTSTGTNPPANNTGNTGLADTGFDILLPIFLGVSLIAAGAILVVRRWLRKRKANATAQN